jgi:hypothetical protein
MHIFYERAVGRLGYAGWRDPDQTIGIHVYPDGTWVRLPVTAGWADAMVAVKKRVGILADVAYHCPWLDPDKQGEASKQYWA